MKHLIVIFDVLLYCRNQSQSLTIEQNESSTTDRHSYVL